jgi:predicted phage terminase large subunit-like protein
MGGKPLQKIEAQPGPQRDFLSCNADMVFYGGAAGSGKSFSLILDPLRYVHNPGYTCINFRRTFPELEGAGGIIEIARETYAGIAPKPVYTSHKFTFPSGATIRYSHLSEEKDIYSHQSSQYCQINFDELTHFTEKQFWYLFSRNRSTCGLKPTVRAGFNPDPDSFVKTMIEWWLDDNGFAIPARSGVIRYFKRDPATGQLNWFDKPTEGAISFTFIPAKLSDNQILTTADPGYAARLNALHPVDRERLLNGNWNVRPVAGNFFPRHCWRFVESEPDGITRRVRAWDRAATASIEADATAGFLLGIKDQTIYILDGIHVRDNPNEIKNLIRRTAEADGHETQIALFQDPGSAGKYEAQDTAGFLMGFNVSIESTSSTGGKINFAKPLSAQALAGNVVLVRGRWNNDFINEAEMFPEGKYDDQIDSASLAFKKCINCHVVLCSAKQPEQVNIWDV